MSTTTPPEIAILKPQTLVSFLKGILLVLFSLFIWTAPLSAQVTPTDSTKGGKGNIKTRTGVTDSTSVVTDSTQGDPLVTDSTRQGGKGSIKTRTVNTDSLPASQPVVIGKDTLPTDTTIGPVSRAAKREARQMARLERNIERGLPDPKIAVRRSLIFPGLGQAYNRSYWKMPIIYGGFATFAYLFFDNHRQYKFFQDVAWCKNDSNPTCDADALYPDYAEFDISSMISERDQFRRLRDLNVIFATLLYTLQAVEAYVDAHLKGFNVSEDLSMHVSPSFNQNPFRRQEFYMGATLSIRIRR